MTLEHGARPTPSTQMTKKGLAKAHTTLVYVLESGKKVPTESRLMLVGESK